MSWTDPVTAGGMPVSGGVISHQQADDEIVDIELDHATILALAATTWATGTPYILEQLVTATPSGAIGPGLYQCILAHTSSGSTFPGAGTYWKALYPAPTSTASATTISVTASPYNADNTGATDATTAINSAISALPTASFTYTCASTSAGNTVTCNIYGNNTPATNPGFVSAFDVGASITVGSTTTTIASVTNPYTITTTAAVTAGNTSITVTRHAGNIFFPVGTYLVTNGLSIPANVQISGQGVGASIITSAGTSSSSGVLTIFGSSIVSDITLQSTNAIHTAYITGVNVKFNRVISNATGSYANGVVTSASSNPLFESCTFNNGASTLGGSYAFCTFTGAYYGSGYSLVVGYPVTTLSVNILNCTFNYGTLNSVNYGGITSSGNESMVVQGCYFIQSGTASVSAILVYNTNETTITGNYFSGYIGTGAVVSLGTSTQSSGISNYVFSNNYVYGGGSSTLAALDVYGSEYGIISGNIFGNQSPSSIACMRVWADGNATYLSNQTVISNNQIFSGTSTVPCITVSGGTNVSVIGNNINTGAAGNALVLNDPASTGSSYQNIVSGNLIQGGISISSNTSETLLVGNVSASITDSGTGTVYAANINSLNGTYQTITSGGSSNGSNLVSIGHIYSVLGGTNTAPTVAAGAQASSVSATAGGTDVRQKITVTALSSGNAAGVLCTVTYGSTWTGGIPYVLLTPLTSAAAAAGLYISASSTTAFTVSCANAPSASASIVFNWKAQG